MSLVCKLDLARSGSGALDARKTRVFALLHLVSRKAVTQDHLTFPTANRGRGLAGWYETILASYSRKPEYVNAIYRTASCILHSLFEHLLR